MHVVQTKRTSSAAVVLTAALLLGLAPLASTQASAQVATPSKLYIESNITSANGNSVIGLQNDGNGNIIALPGSPYLTNGVGVGAGNATDAQWDADGELIMDALGSRLWAVNGNSNTITSFSINADGSLAQVGSPVASNGQQPAALGIKEGVLPGGLGLMVAVNKAADPLQPNNATPNYTTFTVALDGSLTMNAGSTLNLPVNSFPAQAVIRRGSQVQFFGIEFKANTTSSYSMNRSGILSQISSIVPPVANPPQLGAILHPTKQYLYVDQPVQHAVGIFQYDKNGVLTYLRNVFAPGAAICWNAINTAGTRLYTAQTPSSEISVYDLTHPGTPLLLQTFVVSGTGAAPAHMALDPSQRFLYVVDRVGTVHVLDINSTGQVTEPRAAYNLGLPTGTVPLGVIVKP